MVRPLYDPDTVLSFRHMPSWLMLCAAAGAVNAGAFLAVGRFVSHVTGTVTQAGMAGRNWTLMFEYGLVLLMFILGALAAVLSVGLPSRQKRESVVHAIPLLFVSGTVASVGIAGHAGAFGAFGASVEQPSDFFFLCLLSAVMGAQNAAVATNTRLLVRTTHLTGPATDLAVSLATALLSRGAERGRAVRESILRSGKIVAFATGAGLMVPLVFRFEYLAFLCPALLTLVATLSSFVRIPQLKSFGAPVRSSGPP